MPVQDQHVQAKSPSEDFPEYNLTDLVIPALSGLGLSALIKTVENFDFVAKKILNESNAFRLRDIKDELAIPQTYEPVYRELSQCRMDDHDSPVATLNAFTDTLREHEKTKGFNFSTVMEYHQAYKTGKVSPTDIAKEYIAAVKETMKKKMNFFVSFHEEDILLQAAESTKRYENGTFISVLDGVLVVTKDSTDVKGYVSTHGVKSMNTTADEDSFCNANLRTAGCIMAGKTNMHQLGMGVTGCNMDYGYPSSPYKANHFTGGSSSGTAACIAAGLCPVGVGTDGGGSVRLPAALCGLVGLKATYGRISTRGCSKILHLGAQSVGHFGPLASCVTDCAIAYSIMGGPDPKQSNTWDQPRIDIGSFQDISKVKGLRVGFYKPFFEHCTPEVLAVCNKMVEDLTDNYECHVVDITIPRLDEVKAAHFIDICVGSKNGTKHYDPADYDELQPSVRAIFALSKAFTAEDYVQAMQFRTFAMREMERVFSECDVIVTPTAGDVAGEVFKYPNGQDILEGISTGRIMRYAPLANLTGIPAISVPAGYSETSGMPVGIQFMSKWWNELALFQMASAVERIVEKRKPETFYSILKE
eukprot:CFRG2326T1